MCVPAFVLNRAEATQFRPEYVSDMHKSLRQLMNQSKLKFTGQLLSNCQCLIELIHCVPKKNIPNIFGCNLKTNYQILIIFGMNISDTT